MNLPDRVLGPRRIAVVPVQDEAATIADTLDKLTQVVDEVVVVDDGSTDATRREVRAWLSHQGYRGRQGHRHQPGRLLVVERPAGRSAAYRLAFAHLALRLEEGTLSPDDLVLTLDHGAHGARHPLDLLDDLHRLAVKERLDALLVRRERSGLTVQRRVAGALVSAWASLWAGARLHDVETGYRIFRLAPLADALHHYRSARSGHVELAVTMVRLGCRVRNDVLVAVPSRPASIGPAAALADLAAVPAAAFRAETHTARATRARGRLPGRNGRRAELAEVGALRSDGSRPPVAPQLAASPTAVAAVHVGPKGRQPAVAGGDGSTRAAGIAGRTRAAGLAGIAGVGVAGSDRAPGGVWESPAARTIARLAAPLTATAALLGAALWIAWRTARRLRRSLLGAG